jgi:integrase/recombinase XerD
MTAAIVGELLPAARAGADLAPVVEPRDRLAKLLDGWLLAVCKVGATDDDHTYRAYRADITRWLTWCAAMGVDPLEVTRSHTDAWIRVAERTPLERTRRTPAKSTLARWVSTVASFYQYAADEGAVDAVPVRKRSRPKASSESTTVGLSKGEAVAFLRRARDHESARDRALLALLLKDGLRVSEATGADVGAVRPNAGHVTISVTRKGGKVQALVMAPSVHTLVGEYLEQRGRAAGLEGAAEVPVDEPLFATVAGGRVTQRSVYRLVQRVARAAGIPSWRSLSPHSLRHACATLMLDAGVALDRVQDQLGHASPDTTRRYDRARNSLARSGAYALEAFLDDDEAPPL